MIWGAPGHPAFCVRKENFGSRDSLPGREVITHAHPRQSRCAELLYRWRDLECVALVQKILRRNVAYKSSDQLSSGEEIHHIVAAQIKRIQVIIPLRARVSAIDTQHDLARIPISCLPGELVLGDLRNHFAYECLRRTLDIRMDELISRRKLDGTGQTHNAIQFGAEGTGAS